MRVADVVVERRRRAFVAADGHGAYAGRERTHALVISELVVSDVEPTTFVRALHPQRRNDGVHRRVPHVEATAALALMALPLVPRALDAAVRTGQVPSLALQKSICSISRTDEVYSNLIHWRRQGAEAQGAVEHGEVHRDLSELPRRFLFRLHDLALLVHNHLSLGPGHYKA